VTDFDYEHYDAMDLAALIRTREITATEAVDAAIRRIEERNPALNAVVNTLYERALREAADPVDGPLSGVPFLVKDSGIQIAGERTSNGSRFWRDHVAVGDSTVTTRYRAAGLVILGFTNTAENGLACETAPLAHGPTRNPWDASRSCGGSSGGSAVVVAAGMVPACHATDGGGSIRIPSSCNGVFGLKPSRGLAPFGPDLGEGWNGLSVHHAVTRSVRDNAALLDAIVGAEPGDPYSAPPRSASFLQTLAEPLPRLRIAVQTVTHAGDAVDPAVVRAVEDAAKLLEELGHTVVEARPEIDAEALKRAMFVIVASNTAHVLHARSRAIGREADEHEVESITWLWAQEGNRLSGRELAGAIGVIHGVGRRFGRFFTQYDVLLTPTCAAPPLPLRTVDMTSSDLATYYDTLYGYTAFTSPYNCAGVPAASVPLAWDGGLPIGVQIAGPLGSDGTLLQLAAELEQARPWKDRRPVRSHGSNA
jgi:amidase